jgi:dipeptidyl aminopeptidase/acylaminoacyl peptidase
VIWGGVVADYSDLLSNWRRRSTIASPPPLPSGARRWRQVLQDTYGSPETNPDFWNSISANSFVSDISGPVQLHHARGDESVPWEFSQSLADDLATANRSHELYLYEGDNHNISANFGLAMRRSLAFFDTYLKGQ